MLWKFCLGKNPFSSALCISQQSWSCSQYIYKSSSMSHILMLRQCTLLILNPTIWSTSQHCWWSHLASTSISTLSLHWVFLRGHRGEVRKKVMAKPLANRVIVGRKHAHPQTHTHTHISKCINLLAPTARYSSVNTFCQGYSERHHHTAMCVCVENPILIQKGALLGKEVIIQN